MNVCIPVVKDRGLESIPYGHFGSTPLFLLVDTDTKITSVIVNGDHSHQHGNCSPIAALGGHNVDAVIVGGIGQGAMMKLHAMGIDVFLAEKGNAEELIVMLAENLLTRVDPETACAGHGH